MENNSLILYAAAQRVGNKLRRDRVRVLLLVRHVAPTKAIKTQEQNRTTRTACLESALYVREAVFGTKHAFRPKELPEGAELVSPQNATADTIGRRRLTSPCAKQATTVRSQKPH